MVPKVQRPWLAKLLYVMPPRTLETLRLAITEHADYLLSPDGIEGLPLGRFYGEVAARVYVPTGMMLVPAVAPAVLEDLLRERGSGHVFFEPDQPAPRVLPHAAFGPISRQMLPVLGGQLVNAAAPERVDHPLSTLQYAPETLFPLWGVPGSTTTGEAPDDAGGGES